jgi:hypothetical protein
VLLAKAGFNLPAVLNTVSYFWKQASDILFGKYECRPNLNDVSLSFFMRFIYNPEILYQMVWKQHVIDGDSNRHNLL